MSGLAAEKICGLCGADCSNKPRTKDKTGKYFCKECYAQAVARKYSGGIGSSMRTPPASASTAIPAAVLGPDDGGGLEMLNELLEQQVLSGASPAPTARLCTNCHAPLSHDAIICTRCGFNTTSGKQMNVKIAAPRIERSGGSAIWPLPVGVISLVIGAVLCALQVIGIILEVSDSSQGSDVGSGSSYRIGRVAGTVIPILMMGWLARGGYQVLRRNSAGVANLRRWSFYQLILSVLGIGCASIILAGASSSQRLLSSGGDSRELTLVAVGTLFYAGTLAVWSIFLMIWTGLARVKRDAEQWG